jgi:hypothetical protein
MWAPYELVAKIALEKFKDMNPTFTPEFIFLSYLTESDISGAPGEKIRQAKDKGSLIAVGNAWSTTATLASKESEKIQIPYIAPTAVTKQVHDSHWSISLGVDVREAAILVKNVFKDLKKKKLMIIENNLKIQEREYSDAVRLHINNSKTYAINDGLPFEEIIEDLKAEPEQLIFIPGYSNERFILKRIITYFPKATFLVGPQWAHDYTPLIHEFSGSKEIQLYCVTDFFSPENEDAQFFDKKWKEYECISLI